MRISIPPFSLDRALILNLSNNPLVDMLEIDTMVDDYVKEFKANLFNKITNQIRGIRNA